MLLGAFPLFIRLFRIGDVLMPMYFNRRPKLYMDTGCLPDPLHLLYHSTSPAAFFSWVLLSLALAAVLAWGLRRSLHIALPSFEMT